jgi:hypothetical protein
MPIDLVPQAWLIITQRRQVVLQAAAFMLDFLHRPHTKPPEDWNWRTPPLQGMLQEKRLHHKWQYQPATVFDQTESQADEGKGRGHGFNPPLNVPFLIELAQPSLDGGPTACGDLAHVLFGVAPDAGIDFGIGIAANPIGCRGKHTPLP